MNVELMEITAARIREIREELGLSQHDIAPQCGLKQAAWSNWETRLVLPNADALCKIADTCGVSVDWLLGRTDKRGGKTDERQK